ncbi:MAG: restriction endonuclease [Crocinitomicaceae bacterium]|nr:restriction endonuclease [Crocinitomicaceae bacterium]
MNISFDEIIDGDHFEDLVAEFFRDLKSNPDNSISSVEVMQSGIGPDGGRDVLVEFEFSDDIKMFKRKWVVQCKFHDENISPGTIQTINIPGLIHSYNASGYLLICKMRPTTGTTQFFERLNQECKFKYHYECWNGNQFLNKLRLRTNLHSLFFPLYNNYIQTLKQ